LSVQITVTEPSVSTADSRFTTAPRRASSRTPAASAKVMVGSSPSGTLATISPIEKVIAALQPRPAASPWAGGNAAQLGVHTSAGHYRARQVDLSPEKNRSHEL
jgi:hypothetical protein